MKPRFVPWPLLSLALILLLGATAVIGAGEALSRPARSPMGQAPAALNAEAVTLAQAQGQSLAGWFSRGKAGAGAVLLLHGVRSDRRQMVGRAKFLYAAGYSVFLIDLPAHGESSGARITFGYREADGVKAALRYLAQILPAEKIAVVGVSLGAAAVVLAGARPAPSAIVLEAMYPTITEAVTDRLELRFGHAAGLLAPLLLWQLPLRLNLSPDQLRPIDALPRLGAPVLMLAGAEDRHTKLSETQRLYEAAVQPKELWVLAGAAHVDLHAFAPKAYEAQVSDFLRKHLRNAG